MVLQWVEIIVALIGVLVIPSLIFFVRNIRQSLINQLLMIVNEYYSSLEKLIDHNREKLISLETKIHHKSEINALKYNEILSKLNDIETYLEKTNGYRRRGHIARISESGDNNE